MGVGFMMALLSSWRRMGSGNFMSAKVVMGGGRWVPSQMM
jgi:hypothetical protein